ncbi:hypothetical protein [Rhodococcus sp. OK519]|uniref:hypothetical protein n=1 Tax=Rhodococcus sp. OK519 TaxID=2135729 RepID=UPI0011B1F064
MHISFSDSIESTQPQDEEDMRSRTFVVYDANTGNVIHVHRCFGDEQFVEDDAHQRTAMQFASTKGKVEDLRVVPVGSELDLRGEVALHVDLSSGRVVATKAKMRPVLHNSEQNE